MKNLNGGHKTSRYSRAVLALCTLIVHPSLAIVTPEPDRNFGTNATGQDVIAQLGREAGSALLSGVVVQLKNNAPVDVDGDGTNDFLNWSGTLISPEWILTCAHALQGTNGTGGGVNPANIECVTAGEDHLPIAEFRIHGSWQKEQYLLGNDIALIRLAAPIAGVNTFARLSAEPFTKPVGVIMAGFGEEGTGDLGGNGFPGFLSAGLNTLDVAGSGQTTNGVGDPFIPFPGAPASIAFMDFDKWELKEFVCQNGGVNTTNLVPATLSAFSTMGAEHEKNAPPAPCVGTLDPTNGYFAGVVCDFLPADGDSGGPAFLWENYPALAVPPGFNLSGIPVIYGVTSLRNPGVAANNAAVYGNVAGFTLVQSHLGWIYDQVPELANADDDADGKTNREELDDGTDPYDATSVVFNTGLGPATRVIAPVDVALQNIRITRETAISPNETDVEFTMDVRNIETGRYRDLSVDVVTANLPSFSSVVDGQLDITALPELGIEVGGAARTLVVRTVNSNLTALREAILSGNVLKLSAYEEEVYAGPAKYVDQPTDDAFESTTFNGFAELVLVLKNPTSLTSNLQSGDILIGDSRPGAYHPKVPSPTDPWELPTLGQQLPFEVASVTQVNGKTHVAGHKRDLNQILKSGTFRVDDVTFNGSSRDLYDPPVENTYTEAEKENRLEQAAFIREKDPKSSSLADLAGMNAIPWHFNDVAITDALKLSGEVLLRSSGLRFQITFRDFAIKRATAGIDAGIATSMVVETTGTNSNVSVPLVDKQKQLANVPLAPPPGLPITIAGIPCFLNLNMVLSVGAEANAPGGLSIPIETSATIGAEIGWADGQTFATPTKEFIAPHISDPTVYDAVAANVKAWAEARLELGISVGGGLPSVGPSLGVRAQTSFSLEPLNNPWWTLDGDAELTGGFQMSLLGFEVAHVETTEHIATFFHRDSGGPLISPGPNPSIQASGEASGSLAPPAGNNVRWALAFAAPNSTGASYGNGFVTPLSGGGFFVGGGNAIHSFLGVVSAEGHVVWMQHFPTGGKPSDGMQLADGTVAVVGTQGFDWWLAKYDTNGTRLLLKSHRMVLAEFKNFAMLTGAGGDPEFYLAGYQNPVIVTQSDPVVLKLDQNGDRVWCKVYTLDGDDEAHSIRAMKDGNLLLAGNTDQSVGTDPFIGRRGNGLLMKITPAGDVIWASAFAAHWGMLFCDVAEAPDGTLYAVGSHGDLVWNYYPSILVAKVASDGELIDHVLIGEAPDWLDELPDGGDTPYDYAASAVWTGNGLVVAGRTGLGAGTSAFAALLNDELGVRWFSAFDASGAAVFNDVAATPDGIITMGWAENVWTGLFTSRAPAWLLSLPWEGIIRFHPNTGARSVYLQPHVFLSTRHEDFLGRVTDSYGNLNLFSTASATFVPTNSVPPVGQDVPAGAVTTFDTARLERVEPSIVDSYEEWAAYYQLTGTNSLPTGDLDKDGAMNQWEYFTGTDPLRSDATNAAVALSCEYDPATGIATISFQQATAAANQSYSLEYSTDLEIWAPANDTTVRVTQTGSSYIEIDLDWVADTVVGLGPAFFRLVLPEP
jgi:hypothetical protein